jgi:hypothetical protein
VKEQYVQNSHFLTRSERLRSTTISGCRILVHGIALHCPAIDED